MTTVKNKGRNNPQRVLKSIQPVEQIAINITKQASGSSLGAILKGVESFTQSFDGSDQYLVEIKVEKLIPPDTVDSSGSNTKSE